MDALHTEEYKGYTIKIHYDEDCGSPREDDNLGTMACFHRRYDLGDKHEFSGNPEGFREWFDERTKEDGDIIWLPIYMYDHSGIGLSTGNTQYPYNCPWDSGQLGVIYVEHDKLHKEFPSPTGNPGEHGWTEEEVVKQLEQEVETYHQYVSGECYGFSVELGDELIDSCWGFIGEHEYCIKEAKGIVDYQLDKTATWDRFDICEAFYTYAMLHHPGQFSDEYRIFGRLHAMNFKPAPSLSGPEQLSTNGRTIYYGLVRKQLEVSVNH